jgi:O-acetyl-ADP-ribose deacetylase (regulator of RNase III)
MSYIEVDGDLITLAKTGLFDVVTHGCNCFCTMGAGIAPQMAKAFGCDKYEMEDKKYRGDINKLGTIDYIHDFSVAICVNSYTQYQYHGPNNIDYEALVLCMRKINHTFKGSNIGLPKIGCGLAGGDWNRVKQIIQTELKDMHVTVVNYKSLRHQQK